MKKLLLSAIALLFIAGFVSNAAAQGKVKAKELKNLAGNWSGELEYLDYSDGKSKVKLKLRAVNTVKDGRVSQEIFYVEPSGKEVKGGSVFSVSADGTQIVEEKMQWTITKNSYDKKTKTRTIIYETKWKDNDRNADLRETLIIGEKQFSVTKEVRYENTTEYFVRNSHRYWRD